MKKNFTFRLPEDLIKRLDEEAKKQHRSRANLLEVILAEYLKKKH